MSKARYSLDFFDIEYNLKLPVQILFKHLLPLHFFGFIILLFVLILVLYFC